MCTELMNVIHLYLILARYLAAPLLMFSSYIKKKKVQTEVYICMHIS